MACFVPKPSWRPAWRIPEALCAGRRGRLVLIELHGLLRDSLAHLISTHIREAVVECYRGVEDVVAGPAALVLIGVDPRREGEVELMRAKFEIMRELCGEAPIGVVLPHDDAELRRTLGALGVAGVIQHEASLDVAIAAIQLMWVGGSCFPAEPSGDEEVAAARSSPAEAQEPAPAVAAQEPSCKMAYCEMALTSRECDVLRMLREGRQNKIIAFELGISESTVKVHLRNMMKKLHASNRTQVALGANSEG